jgi:hypothetical protein
MALKKHLRFLLKGGLKPFVEGGKCIGVGLDLIQTAEQEPLAGEIIYERFRPRIVEHSCNLLF